MFGSLARPMCKATGRVESWGLQVSAGALSITHQTTWENGGISGAVLHFRCVMQMARCRKSSQGGNTMQGQAEMRL